MAPVPRSISCSRHPAPPSSTNAVRPSADGSAATGPFNGLDVHTTGCGIVVGRMISSVRPAIPYAISPAAVVASSGKRIWLDANPTNAPTRPVNANGASTAICFCVRSVARAGFSSRSTRSAAVIGSAGKACLSARHCTSTFSWSDSWSNSWNGTGMLPRCLMPAANVSESSTACGGALLSMRNGAVATAAPSAKSSAGVKRTRTSASNPLRSDSVSQRKVATVPAGVVLTPTSPNSGVASDAGVAAGRARFHLPAGKPPAGSSLYSIFPRTTSAELSATVNVTSVLPEYSAAPTGAGAAARTFGASLPCVTPVNTDGEIPPLTTSWSSMPS